MPKNIFSFLLIFSAGFFFTTGEIKAEDNKNVDLGEILISRGARLPVSITNQKQNFLENYPSSVTIITSSDIKKQNVASLGELLKKEVSLNVFDSVGNGVDLTVSMRGFNEGEDVVVLIDGVKVNEPDTGTVIYPLISLDDIERIEIIRGSSSAVYGDGVFSGVINIITKKPSAKPLSFDTEYNYGSFQSQKFITRLSGSADKINYYFSGVRDISDGYRSNGGHRITHLNTKLVVYPHRKLSSTLSINHTLASLQNPGALTLSEIAQDRRQTKKPRDGREFDTNIISLNNNFKISENIESKLNLFYRKNDIDFITTSRTFPVFSGTDEVITRTDTRGGVFQLSFDELNLLNFKQNLTLGGEFSFTRQNDEKYDTAAGVKTNQTTNRLTKKGNFGVFFQDYLNLTENLIFNLGLRYDEVSFKFTDELNEANNRKTKFTKASPKIGFVYKFSPFFSSFINYSQSFKAPNISDLFAFPGAGGSNPELGPEKGNNYEFGLRFRGNNKFKINLSFFRIDLKDEIRFDATATSPSFPFGQFVNVAKTKRQGIELEGRYKIFKNLFCDFNYTFLDAKFKSAPNSGNTIPMVPKHKFNINLEYNFLRNFKISLNNLFVGNQFILNDDSHKRGKLKSYFVSGLKLSYEKNNFDIFFAINNLFNRKYSSRAVFATGSAASGFSSGADFFMPAEERRLTLGVKYKF